MSTTYRYSTSWGDGWLRWDADRNAVTALEVPGATVPKSALPIDAAAPKEIRQLAKSIEEYVTGKRADLVSRAEIERWLDAAGVDGFRRKASLALCDVPYGVTLSYGELAELAGAPRAARAAGSMCSRNPLPLVVPCHRVLPANGRLGRYGTQGPDYKKKLLRLEGVATS
jgi:methylated-DNA-[protein]-cysteine S-methyltransferase